MLRLGLTLAPLACGATALSGDPCEYPNNCPNKVYPRADKQTWMMNKSTIIMPCNNTGYTDPESTKGWGIVDCKPPALFLSHIGLTPLDICS